MQRILLLIAGIGIVIIAAVSLAGYYLGKLAEERSRVTPSPTPVASPSPEAAPSPSPTPAQPSLLPTAPPPHVPSQVIPQQGTPLPSSAAGDIRISFVNLPTRVQSGQPFVVQWHVEAPANVSGKTALSLSYNVSSSNGSSRASTSSSGKQSFSFGGSRTFSSNFTYSGASGTITVTATAEAGGTTVETRSAVQLVQ